MLLSIFLKFSSNAFKFSFFLLIISLTFRFAFAVVLCALQNFIQKIDHNENAITDLYQAAYTSVLSDIGNNAGGGFITENNKKENSKVKLQRKNIANKIWKSYLNYMANTRTRNSNNKSLGLSE